MPQLVAFFAFSNPHAEAIVQSVGDAEFVVDGVATDYCIRAAVFGLRGRGKRVTVVHDAIAAANAEAGPKALGESQRGGVRFQTADEVCQTASTRRA